MPKQRIVRPGAARGANRGVLLSLLRHQPRLSRIEIARQSGLSPGAVSRIIAELIREGLIIEDGARTSTGGRPQTRLRLNPSGLITAGVEVHHWDSRIAVGGLGGQILEDQVFRTASRATATLDQIVEKIRDIEGRYSPQRIEGVGISIPGVVNTRTGVVEIGFSPEWNHCPVAEYLGSRLKLPVFVENSTRAAALAEHDFGGVETQHSSCLLFVVVDEGVGIGVVLDGKVYYGSHMAAGEFGQMIISDTPGLTEHDIPGSLEQLTFDPETCARYQQMTAGAAPRKGLRKFRETAAQVRAICRLATEGDEKARASLTETCRFLGIGICNVVWGLNPDIVVISGAITAAWPLVRETIQQAFPKGEEFLNFRRVMLRASGLRGQAAILGALSLPLRGIFSEGAQARS